jgi:hypothetical protein
VLAVKMNRKRLVAVLEEQIYIYDIATMKHVYTIESGPNPNGKNPPLKRHFFPLSFSGPFAGFSVDLTLTFRLYRDMFTILISRK